MQRPIWACVLVTLTTPFMSKKNAYKLLIQKARSGRKGLEGVPLEQHCRHGMKLGGSVALQVVNVSLPLAFLLILLQKVRVMQSQANPP